MHGAQDKPLAEQGVLKNQVVPTGIPACLICKTFILIKQADQAGTLYQKFRRLLLIPLFRILNKIVLTIRLTTIYSNLPRRKENKYPRGWKPCIVLLTATCYYISPLS